MSHHVRKGWAARERRYRSAVQRQIQLWNDSFAGPRPRPYFYADPEEFLRRGDELSDFLPRGGEVGS